ncbi:MULTISPECIES: glutamate ABC transporter substrate-binding protein [unclassified Spirillospora]|uniref:glutamate ABC transporter substrate-binding protein n=1 Tax=unclassified Spirillospora TaxID=2642701 RepID=UPI00371B2D20
MHAARSNRTLIATAALAALSVVILVTSLAVAPLLYGADDGPSSITDLDALVIGVKDDQPGLSLRTGDGELEGFDIDVATYVGGRLGISPEKLTFRPLSSDERESALSRGTVDLVVATYSITPERKQRVTFAGPYYVAHQDILVRPRETSIKTVRDLRGKRLCQVPGSNSWRRVTEERGVAAELVPAGSYSECVKALAGGRLDAVSTDDLILAGFAAGSGTTLVNAPFSDERYGIGLRKGDLGGCQAVNRILTGMYQNGTAETLLGQWFTASGLEVTTTVPEFEGCA